MFEELKAWLCHHFVMPDMQRRARSDLAHLRMEMFKAHEQCEKATATLICYSERERRLAALCGDRGPMLGMPD